LAILSYYENKYLRNEIEVDCKCYIRSELTNVPTEDRIGDPLREKCIVSSTFIVIQMRDMQDNGLESEVRREPGQHSFFSGQTSTSGQRFSTPGQQSCEQQMSSSQCPLWHMSGLLQLSPLGTSGVHIPIRQYAVRAHS
jgi:hypothetical protein